MVSRSEMLSMGRFDLTNIINRARGFALLAAASFWLGAGAPASAEATTAQILEGLRSGGHIIYLRHAQTDQSTKDSDLSDMSNCSNQRLLSAEGRETATKLGEAFKTLKIPVETVITSQFCRARETAKLMGYTSTSETADLNNDTGEPVVSKEESERRSAALRKFISTAPGDGKNTLIVGHVPNIRNAVSLDYAKMKEGEIAVFVAKSGEDGYEAVGRITPDELLSVAETASK